VFGLHGEFRVAKMIEACLLGDVYFPAEGLKERDIAVSTGLGEAQHLEILGEAARGDHAVDAPAVLGKRFDGGLGVVVVPGHTVMVKEVPALVPVFAKSLGGFSSQIALVFPIDELAAERFGVLDVLG